DADLEREVAQLELGLLEDEVKLLRTQVGEALKARVEYQTGITRAEPKAWDDAQRAYEIAARLYLDKARDLAKARRSVAELEEPTKSESKAKDGAASSEGLAGDNKAAGTGSHVGGAAVGSIDMAAVFRGYEKARQYSRQLNSDRHDARRRLEELGAEA